MRLIAAEAIGIRLGGFTAFQEQHPNFFSGHTGNKGFGVIKRGAQLGDDGIRIDGFRTRERAPLG